ncbi:MAG: competence protein ComK [bacterium]|jgi:comK protein|nr:competence protein ComK [bacterium]
MNQYEINDATLAIIPDKKSNSLILEEGTEYKIEAKPLKIIDYSCKYFGSSYVGRREGSKQILQTAYKLPIMIEDTRNIVFFPTNSPEETECSWIALNKIEKIRPLSSRSNYTEIEFANGKILALPISYKSLENQILRASRLESVIRNRRS